MKIFLLFLSFCIKTTNCICYNENEIISKGYTTFQNKVYDISNYNHPGGIQTLLKSKGKKLETFFNDPDYNFHLESSSETFPDLAKIYIGDVCQEYQDYQTLSLNNLIFRYLEINDTIKIIAETPLLYPTKQWISIGFPKKQNEMTDSTVVVGAFDSDNITNNRIQSFYIDSTIKTNPLNIFKNEKLNFTFDESIKFENKKIIIKFGVYTPTISNFIYAIGNRFTVFYISKHIIKGSFSINECSVENQCIAPTTSQFLPESEKETSNGVMSLLWLTSFFIIFILTVILTHSHHFNYCMKNIPLFGISLGTFWFFIIYFIWWIALLVYSFLDSTHTIYRLGIWVCLNISSSLLPITHNSLWVIFFNLSYERLLQIHKFMSTLSVLSVLIKLIVCMTYYSPEFFLVYRPLMGLLASIFTFLLFILSLPYCRRKKYELFLYSHQILCVSIIITSSLHYILSLYYFLPFILLYVFDIFLRYVYTKKVDKWKITTIKDNPCVFLSVTIENTKPRTGCYYFIKVDKISKFELHPISLLFHDSHHLLFCIKDMGEKTWSNQLRNMKNDVKTNIYVQGPYGCLTVDFKKNNYENVFLIAGGVGVTPFPSIINEIQELHYLKKLSKLKKVIFIWIIQDFVMLEYFRRYLRVLNSLIDFHIYITKDTEINNTVYDYSPYMLKYKKPNIKQTIQSFYSKFKMKSETTCVISCGPKGLCDDIQEKCDEKSMILFNETYLK